MVLDRARLIVTLWIAILSLTPNFVDTCRAQPNAGDRKFFRNSVVPLGISGTPNVAAIESPDPNREKTTLTLRFTLEPANQAELEEKAASGQTIDPAELGTKYAASQEDYDKLVNWLKAQGFQVVGPPAMDRTSVSVSGTVPQIEKSLGIHMKRVVKDGIPYYSADGSDAPPSLPFNVAAHVIGINGLQPFLKANRNHIRFKTLDSSVPTTESRSAPVPMRPARSAMAAPTREPPYLARDVLKAYDAENLDVTGAGETIAILIDTVPAKDDLARFWQLNGLSLDGTNVQTINVGGGALPATEGEETLDVEWTSGIAPGATIRVYAAGSLDFVDLDTAIDAIIADLPTHRTLHQLSISLGLGEKFMSPDEVNVERQKFARLAVSGVNVFVSSGDAGSNPDVTGHGSAGPLQVEYESSDPFVVAVGGTTLRVDPSNGTVTNELGWSGSGGGISNIFARPKWQKGVGVIDGDKRLVPDVSLVADPDTGVLLHFQGRSIQEGGTSLSAPVWAGFCALMNENRTKKGKSPLPFLDPLVYPLLGTINLRDVTQGNNGKYSASKGYDMVTGVGVPSVKALMQALN